MNHIINLLTNHPLKKLVLLLLLAGSSLAQTREDSVIIRKIYNETLTNGQGYEWLRYLCKQVGPRLSGSEGAKKSSGLYPTIDATTRV